jgi:hypothetical protein
MSSRITERIHTVRRLLSRCAEQFTSFDAEIVRILGLQSSDDYSSIIDCFYTFEDTELAKDYIRRNGLAIAKDQQEFGLVYLKFYGFMNACYLQQQAVIVCNERLSLATDLARLNAPPLIQFRNDFAAHSPNRGRGRSEHSYILDRFGLLEGRVSGYSSNAPTGVAFKDAMLVDLLSDWDGCFLEALTPVCQHITDRITHAGVSET